VTQFASKLSKQFYLFLIIVNVKNKHKQHNAIKKKTNKLKNKSKYSVILHMQILHRENVGSVFQYVYI